MVMLRLFSDAVALSMEYVTLHALAPHAKGTCQNVSRSIPSSKDRRQT